MAKKVPLSFYLQDDVVSISKQLIGKMLFSSIDGKVCGGKIVETEAYQGPEDKASHAFGNKKTARTQTMFEKGGVAYIYKCYGMYDLFNVVTNTNEIPHAVLIRAIEPLFGIETMLERRGAYKVNRSLCGGPGRLTIALGLTTKHDGTSLQSNQVWIEEGEDHLSSLVASPRVGIDYAEEFAPLPWRFRLKDNPFTSPAK